MPKISALTPLPGSGTAGPEEFVINKAGVDYKCTAAQITDTVTTNLNTEISTRTSEVATLTSGKLDKSGGTMTGDLTLAGGPTANLHAATKLYVDTAVSGVASLASPSLTGSPTAPTATASATSGSTQIATTDYVADAITEQTSLKKTTLAAASLSLTSAEKGTIEVDYSATGTTNITLPIISGLTNPEDYEYYLVDTGNNAGTNTITVTAGAGDTVAGGATTTITTDGASLLLANSGGTNWYVKDADADASTTVKGLVELATTAEAAALTDSTRAVTAAGVGAVLDAFPYNITQLGSASHVLTEADTGTLYITRTTTGTCSIQLPDPAGLTSSARTQYAIYDAGAAGTNNATITTAGGTIDGGSSFVINNDKMGATFITDGTNWFSIANTNTAFSGGASTPWQYNGVDIYFDQKVVIGDTTATNSLFNLDKANGAGDVAMTFSQGGTGKFIIGIDDTDDDFKLSASSTLGSSDILEIDSTNSHIAWGTAPTANDKFTIYGQASALHVLTVKNSSGLVGLQNKEDRTTYMGQGVSVGANAPLPNADGVNINGSYFTDGWKVGLSTTGSSITGGKVQLTTVNPGYTHTGLRLECTNADNNYALVTAAGGGNVGFGTETPNSSAILELDSTTGALLLPRMTTAQEGALTATNGMMIYNTSTNKVRVYEGGAWANVI